MLKRKRRAMQFLISLVIGGYFMNWLIFLGGAMFGGTMGVFAMALLQANRYSDEYQ